MDIKIEYVATSKLLGYEKNARTHSDNQVQQIAESIRQFGFTNPVLIDDKNMLVAGHGRTEAAKLMGMESVPAIRLQGLTPEKIKALRIADNQLALNAGWDLDLLAEELSSLESEDFDLSVIGFESEFLDDLLSGMLTEHEGDNSEDDDQEEELPLPPADPISVEGDLWVLGRHRLLCGDSTSIDAVEKLAAGKSVDLLVTDPPYNVAYEGKTSDALTIQNDDMSDDDFRQFLRDVYSAADSVMRPGAAFYIWHADSEGYNFRGAAHDIGWQVRQCLIWNKNTLVLGRQDYHWKHEPCLYGWKEGAAHYWGNDRKQTTVLEFNKPQRNGEHPTMKPVDLIEYQVMNSSKRGDTVMDLFGGSGTTLIACENTGRTSLIMELDPKYVDVIIERWQKLTGKQAAIESTGQTFAELKAIRGGAKVMPVNQSAMPVAANDDVFSVKRRA
jgi:DNA modification methylase